MKKILAIILALSCAFVMFACGETEVCETCVDEDKNCVCDVCSNAVECVDADADLKCDNCGKDIKVDKKCEEHVDEDGDGYCDVCELNVVTGGCIAHKDENKDTKCDTCGAEIPCTAHVDADKNAKCDVCAATVKCKVHVDVNKNAECDVCGEEIPCETHLDVNKDGECDVCGETYTCVVHIDAVKDGRCDVCGDVVNCISHIDSDKNGKCDVCDAEIVCFIHVDVNKDGKCDNCANKVECLVHTDLIKDNKCDVCGADVPCFVHYDAIKDGKCDICGEAVELICADHVDADGDKKCDICDAAIVATEGGSGNTSAQSAYEKAAAKFIAALEAGVNEGVWVGVAKGQDIFAEYSTVYNADGSYVMTYSYPKFAEDFNEDDEIVTGQIVFDKDGNCIEGDATIAAQVGAKGLKANLAYENIDAFKVSGNSLMINVNAENSAEVIGVELASDAVVVVFIDENAAIASISLTYVDADNDYVVILCTYS